MKSSNISLDAYSTAKFLFEQASYPVPEIEILSHNGKSELLDKLKKREDFLVQDHSTNPVTIVYIPSHLYHIVFELLKVVFEDLISIEKSFVFRIQFVQRLNDMV